MDETIRVRSVKKINWDAVIEGFEPEKIQQVLEIYGSEGERVGIICESLDGQAYINGQPQTAYASLQAAATTLMKNLRTGGG